MKSRETLDSVMWVYIISRRHNLALEAGACGIEGYTCGVVVKPKYRTICIKTRLKVLKKSTIQKPCHGIKINTKYKMLASKIRTYTVG